jgi:GntR family transcriptional regulator
MTISALDGVGSLQAQVRRTISQEIADGIYGPGAQLPTEKEYAERLGVSLITVRNALASLVQAGYIERASGRGTFVSSRKSPYQIALMSSATDSLRAAGVPFEVQGIAATIALPPDDVRRTMKLAKGTSAFRLKWVAIVAQRPAIVVESWVRRSTAKAFENDIDVADGHSLCTALGREAMKPARADGCLELTYADEGDAELLRLPFGAPLFAYESTTRDDSGRVIERARATYDASRFALTIAQI